MRPLLRTAACLLLSTTFLPVHATVYTAAANGNWSAPATWGTPGVPTTGDIAIIPAGVTVTVDAAAGTLDPTWGSFNFYNPSRIEVFGTLNVNGNSSAYAGVLFENPISFEVYSGGVAKDNDVQGAFNLVETSTITVYSGGTFYLFPAGGPAPYSTEIFDITSDPFGGPGTAYWLGDDGTVYNGNNPTVPGPFTVKVPSGTPGIDASFVQATDPSSVSAAASGVGSSTATLNGTVGSGGLATSNIQFQYSTNSTLSSGVTTVAATPATLPAGSGTSSVTASIASLAANTTYYYRVSATNSLGTTQGNILSLTTATSLPVTFISFTARSEGDDVNLGWTVGVNQQARTYEVEHSVDGISFSKIGQVSNNPENSSYGFVHTHAEPGKHYYRILETDFDGESIYSTIVAVTVTGQGLSLSVLNNPAAPATNTRLQINTGSGGTAFVELWSIGGARLSLLQRSVTAGSNTVDLPMSGLPAGVYVVKVRVNGHIRTTEVIRK